LGNIVQEAIRDIAEKDAQASLPALYDMRFLKPLDTSIMQKVAQDYDHIITIEDGALNGGFGSAILEWLADNGYAKRVTRLGIPDRFIEHGSPAELYHIAGLDAESIIRAIRRPSPNNRPSPTPSLYGGE
jgi:1-deoxy-D-xylulose-5-phosphate synthase